MKRVLFVCLGNICRSPAAEAVFAAKAAAAGLAVAVDSAGTGGWHTGDAPYPPMIAAAARRGYDLSRLRARQVRAADFNAFDLIVAMDRANLAALEALRPGGSATPVALMRAHWCTLPTGRLAVRDARLPLPASRRDGPGRSPFDGLRETRRVAGAGRMKRATG